MAIGDIDGFQFTTGDIRLIGEAHGDIALILIDVESVLLIVQFPFGHCGHTVYGKEILRLLIVQLHVLWLLRIVE